MRIRLAGGAELAATRASNSASALIRIIPCSAIWLISSTRRFRDFFAGATEGADRPTSGRWRCGLSGGWSLRCGRSCWRWPSSACKPRAPKTPRISTMRPVSAATERLVLQRRAPADKCARCSCRRTSSPTACTATLPCIDCHTTITETPHQNLPATLAECDRAAARHQQELRQLPCAGLAELYGDLSWPSRRLGLRRYRDLLRLPRQPRDPLRRRSGFERVAGQSAEDLPEVPSGRDAGLRDVPVARHHRRLCALSLCVDCLEIRDLGGRRRAGDLLDPFGALVLPRISRPPAAQAEAACAEGSAAARRRPLLPTLERRCGDGLTSYSRSASSCWS